VFLADSKKEIKCRTRRNQHNC